MSNKRKKRNKKATTENITSKILLAVAILEIIKVVLEIIKGIL